MLRLRHLRRPAATAQEAIQWLYFAYLAAVKEQNGAAMSLGRISTFLDIYLERDLDAGTLTEQRRPGAHRRLRDQAAHRALPAHARSTTRCSPATRPGSPSRSAAWATTAARWSPAPRFRFLQTLYNLGPAPEPNLTVLWSAALPTGFKEFCAKVSIDTSAIQYENDDLLRESNWGDDDAHRLLRLGHARSASRCSSSAPGSTWPRRCSTRSTAAATRSRGKQVRRARRAGHRRHPGLRRRRGERFDAADGLAGRRLRQRAEHHPLHARQVRLRAPRDGAARLRHPCARWPAASPGCRSWPTPCRRSSTPSVHPVRDETGLITDYRARRRVPGVRQQRQPRRRHRRRLVVTLHGQAPRSTRPTATRVHTQSVLTITSNVVYGKNTGNTPDGRASAASRSPRAPTRCTAATSKGLLAAALSVAKLPYDDAAGRHLADRLGDPVGPGQDRAGARGQPGRRPRRLLRQPAAST